MQSNKAKAAKAQVKSMAPKGVNCKLHGLASCQHCQAVLIKAKAQITAKVQNQALAAFAAADPVPAQAPVPAPQDAQAPTESLCLPVQEHNDWCDPGCSQPGASVLLCCLYK